jgi:hypothetical protein
MSEQMKHGCIHCGQVSEIDDPAAQSFTCPICGKNSWIAEKTGLGETRAASRFRVRDIAIGAIAALAFCALAFLFFRRDQPIHRLIFGEMRGPVAETTANPPSSGAGSGAAVSSGAGPIGTVAVGNDTGVPVSSGGGGSITGGSLGPGSAGLGQPAGGTAASIPGDVGPVGSTAIDPATGLPSSPGGSQVPGPAGVSGGTGVSGSGTLADSSPAGGSTPANLGASGTGLAANSGAPAGQSGSSAPIPSPSSAPNQGAANAGQAGNPDSASSGGAGGVGNAAGSTPSTPTGAGTTPNSLSGGSPASSQATSRPQTASAGSSGQGMARATPGQSPSQTAAGTPGARTSAPQSAGASPGGSPSPTRPDQVAKEGTDELLGLAKKDDTAQQKPADASSGSTASQLAALASTDAKSAQGDSAGSTPGNDASDTDSALTGKKPDDDRSKLARPFDPERGSNMVFVLDRSLSMHGEKSRVARRELVQTLQKLGPNKSFYVIFFPEKAMPASGLLRATPENVQSMTNWIYSLGHAFGSDPTKAMLKALNFRPDTIWLLSDGRFSDEVSSTIRLANENIHSQINTIGFYSQDGEGVLKQIAEENHGTYRFVPPRSKRAAGEFAPIGDTQNTQP